MAAHVCRCKSRREPSYVRGFIKLAITVAITTAAYFGVDLFW